MNKSKLALAVLAVVGVSSLTASSALAYGGGFKDGARPHREGRAGLIPQEVRMEIRAQHQNMAPEERAAHKEEHQAMRAEKRAALEEFTGLSREEMRELKKEGGNIGDVLAASGKTQDEAQAFLTEQANLRVDRISDHHDLTEDQEQTIRERINDFVQKILGRWFN